MARYRALRDFGSHLGNHYRGQVLTLPEGELPKGFAGLVERVAETKDVVPASERANDDVGAADVSVAAPSPEAGSVPPASDDDPADQARAGYADKMVTSARQSGRRP